MNRRRFLFFAAAASGCIRAVAASSALQSGESGDPWTKDRLLEPAQLASRLNKPSQPLVISVAFPVLYRQKHITGALFAGPTSKPEGIALLKQRVQTIPKATEVVLYCGCCPMEHCPNIRPAYATMRELGYPNVYVLHLPTNFRTDWEDKGYPVQAGTAASATTHSGTS